MAVRDAASTHVRILGVIALLAAASALLVLLPADAAAQQPDDSVASARVGGGDRFDTAARIAGMAFDEADVAVLATGSDFPDALAGSFAGGLLRAPILLVEEDEIPGPTASSLEDLGIETVVLLGGPGAISDEVEASLQEDGYETDRLGGRDRYDTATTIAQAYGDDADAQLDGDRTAILASGEDFPDVLSAGPLAARAQLPLLLTRRGQTPTVVTDTLEDLDIDRIVVIGGTAVVSEDVVDFYQRRGYTVERIAGATRDDTAAKVADNAIARVEGFAPDSVLLARGDDFPDALAASAHAGLAAEPILLTANPEVLGGATYRWLADRCPDVDVIRALGGHAAVAASTLDDAVFAAAECHLPEREEVARFTTPLPHNHDRTHNIHLAADYIDGDVIRPGESYSLNQGIGRRTRARGFREVQNGCIGAGGEPVDCVGGGVSQMGTTFMNVAWRTGIELREFRPHSVYFSRYPVCHEATLSYGSLDVVVHNDSPHDIVVDTFYDNDFIGVRYLSRRWAEVSSWAVPEEPPSSGSFHSQCGRTISYPDGTSREESYQWTYDDVGF